MSLAQGNQQEDKRAGVAKRKMANFSGRRGQGVNVSQYISNLNEIRSDASPEESTTTLEEELAMFTNNNFVDWDANNPRPRPSSISLDLDGQPPATATTSAAEPSGPESLSGDLSSFDFNIGGDYGFDFHTYTGGVQPFPDNIGNLQPIQPSPTFAHSSSQQRAFGSSTSDAGEKRKATGPGPRQLSFEEQSRLAAEEDKRRRNTAASARFRVKKKQREQALEKSQKELSDKVGTLEGRIQSLETENKWLRELVMEKNGGNEKIVSALLQEQREKDESSKKSKAASPKTS